MPPQAAYAMDVSKGADELDRVIPRSDGGTERAAASEPELGDRAWPILRARHELNSQRAFEALGDGHAGREVGA